MTRALSLAVLALAFAACHGDGSHGSLRGTITVSGAPDDGALAGIAVTLTRSGDRPRSIATGSGGAFRAADLPPGRYLVSVTIGDTVEQLRTITVDVGASVESDAGVLAFAGLGAIAGSVSDEQGAPLAAARLFVEDETAPDRLSDADGRFVLADVPVGPHSVVAFLSGRLLATAAVASVTWRGRADAGTLVLAPGPADQTLRARVSWPDPSTKIPLIQVIVDGGQWKTTTNAAGAFEIPNVSDGTHSLAFIEVATARAPGQPLPLYNELPSILFSRGQAVALGDTVEPLTVFPLYRGRRLSAGRLTDVSADGQRILTRDGTRYSVYDLGRRVPTAIAIAPGEASCALWRRGVLCATQVVQNSTGTTRITYYPFDGSSARTLSTSAGWYLRLGGDDRIALIERDPEDGSRAQLRFIDCTSGAAVAAAESVALDNYYEMAASPSGARVAVKAPNRYDGTPNPPTLLFDSGSGAVVWRGNCYNLGFVGESLVANCQVLVEVDPAGAQRTLYQGFGGSAACLSPDGAYMVRSVPGWTGNSAYVFRRSDGALVAQRYGWPSCSWSADGARVWLGLQKNDASPFEVAEVQLASGAVRSIATVTSGWAQPAATRPELWLVTGREGTFAVDALSGQRLSLAEVPSTLIYRSFADGMLMQTPRAGGGYGLDWIAFASLQRSSLADGIRLDVPYDETGIERLPATGDGARAAYINADSANTLTILDRGGSGGPIFVGGPVAPSLREQYFLADGALLANRGNAGRLAVGGVYLTELTP
jgi:hypothetical protein